MSESNTSQTSFETKVKLLAEFVELPNKSPEQERLLRFHGVGCHLAYLLYRGYVADLQKGFQEIQSAWESLLSLALNEDIWDDYGNLLPEFSDMQADSLSEL